MSRRIFSFRDRFIKGQCPNCKADDQYGDNCENCGATYTPTELLNPKSVLSGKTPIEKESEHYFFTLDSFREFLKSWTQDPKRLQKQATNKLNEWFEAGLQDWDISRDAPYFGFNIPGAENKFFYVWLDAPIGYMASFKNYCDKNGLSFDEYWARDSSAGAVPYYWQGHTLFSCPFLAGDARRFGFPHPDIDFCPRIFNRQRRENVQVPGHVYQGQNLSGSL